jgi:small-conductance mechanosensitive channel
VFAGRYWSKCNRAALLAMLAAYALATATFSATAAVDPAQVIKFLGQTIDWYRAGDEQSHIVDQPTDVLFVYDSQQLSAQVLDLAFAYARAQAQLLETSTPTAENGTVPNGTHSQNIARLLAQADDALGDEQSKIEILQKKAAGASGQARTVLESQLVEEQSKLALLQTRADTLKEVLQFSSGGAGTKPGGDLNSQIAALEQSVPEVQNAQSSAENTETAKQKQTPAPAPQVSIPQAKSTPAGILGLSQHLWTLRSKLATLREALRRTDVLIGSAHQLMVPLTSALTDAARQGNELAREPESPDPKLNAQRKAQIDAIDTQFKKDSSAFLPLDQLVALLNQYQANLESWRATVVSQQKEELKSLAIRLGLLALALLVAAAISSLWRRVTFHYVADTRRRHQFLFLRRIVMFCVFAVIIVASLSTDISSFTTFAGLLAAGLAVSLQSVILSALGYFVLLGKYRLHIGDRIEISGVTGNVVDIDLMRISLMEVGKPGSGADGVPTGRTVEFPNAVVFQPTVGFFKQIPGTNFMWHELIVTLARGDHRMVEQRIWSAVDKVFRNYRENVEMQHHRMERALNLTVDMPQPYSRLRFTQTGLEMIVRYPVTRENAAEIDDRITRALLEVMEGEPTLKSVASPVADGEAADPTTVATLKGSK